MEAFIHQSTRLEFNQHWLDVVDRVNYKIGLLVYKCLHGLAPGYLSDQCVPASTFAGRANMRSSSRLDRLLYVPRTKTKTLGPRGFYYASSAVWNSLPVDLRDPGLSLHSFRTKLKSYFFTVDWFFSVVHSCTLFCSFNAVRANVMFISWRVQMSELNWMNEMKITIYMARTSRSVASESEARGHVTGQDKSWK